MNGNDLRKRCTRALRGARSLAKRRALAAWVRLRCLAAEAARDARGQGTTEYAILVGVLVVIAIIAIGLFKPKIQELWTAIADGINGL